MSPADEQPNSQTTREILEDLAAGRIGPDEAASRIDQVREREDPAPATPDPRPAGAVDPAGDPAAATVDDAWAASTDRPQRAGHARDSFPSASRSEQESEQKDEQTRAGSGSETASPTGAAGRSGRLGGRGRKPSTGGVERLSIRAVGRRVRVIGEPSVATVSADGPHVLRRNGSVLEISSDGEFGASIDGFQLLRGAPRNLDDFRSLGLGKELLLRVNPALLVDVEVTAGSLNTEGVTRFGSVRVTAGGARLLDVSEIGDALIQAGQATVKGAIASGRSRIRIESGSLNLQLADASNVTIATEAQLGKVNWAGAHAGFTGDEVVMGNGSAKLEVEVMMGHASIKAGTHEPSASGAA